MTDTLIWNWKPVKTSKFQAWIVYLVDPINEVTSHVNWLDNSHKYLALVSSREKMPPKPKSR